MALFGIDLGGTKVEGVVLEGRDNIKTVSRLRVPTESEHGYQHTLDQIARLVDKLIAESGIKPEYIGIGHPGTLDPQTGVIKNANSTALNGKKFDKDISAHLDLPVRLANDANCFAIAETIFGSVKDVLPTAKVVFGVIMGTGVGGGIVVNGNVISGRQGIAGEWGHNFLDESGGRCYCGKVGCVETIISGPALQKYYKNLTGQDLSLSEINKLAEQGKDPAAVKTIDRLVFFFGKAIANVINILDPDVVVLGGGVGNISRLYNDGLLEVQKYIFNPRIDTLFVKPKLGDSAGVFGAALL